MVTPVADGIDGRAHTPYSADEQALSNDRGLDGHDDNQGNEDPNKAEHEEPEAACPGPGGEGVRLLALLLLAGEPAVAGHDRSPRRSGLALATSSEAAHLSL